MARSLLFVPGDRPDRFAKAATSGCDVVIIDLEDAVARDRKVDARQHADEWLAAGHRAVVRVNGSGTPWHEEDLATVAAHATAVMLPKAEDPEVLPAGVDIIPLIETARGVVAATDVCAAPGVVRPAFGSVDLAHQLGIDHQRHTVLRHARSQLVIAAAAASCAPPIDGVTTTINDDGRIDADLRHAAELGFTAKLCIHPSQIESANIAFSPSADDIAWAQSVLDVTREGSVAVHNGQMIDRPIVLRAEAILRQAGADC